MKRRCFTHETCFPLTPPTKTEYAGFGSAPAFFVNSYSSLIPSPTSNFVYEILNVWLRITTPRWSLHSDDFFTLLPLKILTALFWICPCTIKYDSESFRKYSYRVPVHCSMSQLAWISPTAPATLNFSAKATSFTSVFLEQNEFTWKMQWRCIS